MKFLMPQGASLAPLWAKTSVCRGASFHGHWRLCKFLIQQGAEANHPVSGTGETPSHAALCTPDRMTHNLVLSFRRRRSQPPDSRPDVETGAFMRDCRTKAETPLHRAAA